MNKIRGTERKRRMIGIINPIVRMHRVMHVLNSLTSFRAEIYNDEFNSFVYPLSDRQENCVK